MVDFMKSKDKYNNKHTEYPRLLAALGSCVLTDEQFKSLARLVDVSEEGLRSTFQRATDEWLSYLAVVRASPMNMCRDALEKLAMERCYPEEVFELEDCLAETSLDELKEIAGIDSIAKVISGDSYSLLRLNFAHVLPDDRDVLADLATDTREQRVLGCENECFVKLKYAETVGDTSRVFNEKLSPRLNRLLSKISEAGFMLVEFDKDADVLPSLPTYN